MGDLAYLRHAASLGHDTGPHPERPQRITAIEAALDPSGLTALEAPAAPREALLAVHPESHLDYVRGLAERGGGMVDMDTVVSAGSWEAAVHAAGGAAAMADLLLDGSFPAAFCGLRPPGHHAERGRAMGFCLLNNVAVAARRARDAHGVARVLVLDWDVHHGNGTQEVFEADPGVLLVSIHQWPLYPGTGAASETGTGEGEGHTVNLPVPPGSGDEVFVSHVVHVVAPLARAYDPGLILVSAGYDAHADDPLADCAVTDAGYGAMASAVAGLARETGVPVGAVLEGGYDLDVLAACVPATLDALRADAPEIPAVAEHPLSAEARGRLATWWPGL
ncbi:MAG TPA: histone deacetylase [Solirubrobacteraceae bacterium]|nr:histone deacetylase [Solirubrobacteraceae bacterium]